MENSLSTPIAWDKLDPGVRPYVKALRDSGIETIESCEGGEGNHSDLPWIRLGGKEFDAGLKAVSVSLYHGLPVTELRRVWYVGEDNMEGPDWHVIFSRRAPLDDEEI